MEYDSIFLAHPAKARLTEAAGGSSGPTLGRGDRGVPAVGVQVVGKPLEALIN